jgi:hypothetical protein
MGTGDMTGSGEDAPDEAEDLEIGDVVQLREPHNLLEAGTRGRVIGFYARAEHEALLALDDGRQLSVPTANLEVVS